MTWNTVNGETTFANYFGPMFNSTNSNISIGTDSTMGINANGYISSITMGKVQNLCRTP